MRSKNWVIRELGIRSKRWVHRCKTISFSEIHVVNESASAALHASILHNRYIYLYITSYAVMNSEHSQFSSYNKT